MQNKNIFDSIRDYAGASERLRCELLFIREEIVKINEADPATLDDDTWTLNKEIDRAASTALTLAERIYYDAKDNLGTVLTDLAYELDRDNIEKQLAERVLDEDDEEDPATLAKHHVAALLCVPGFEFDDFSGADDEGDDDSVSSETDEVSPEALASMSDDEFDHFLEKRYGLDPAEASQDDLDDDEAKAA